MRELAEQCGRQIVALRAKRFTQAELADLIGVPQGTLSRWETGARIPRDYYRLKIADALGVSVDVLFFPLTRRPTPRVA